MINFVEYLGRELNFRRGIELRVDSMPPVMLQELDARRKVGIWWLQPDDEYTFKVIGRSVIGSYHLSHGSDRRESAFMDPDLSESYSCLGSLGRRAIVKVPGLVLAGQNFHLVDHVTHSLISCAVRDSTKITLSKTKGYIPGRDNLQPDEKIAPVIRSLFKNAFELNVNEAYLSRRQDTHNHVSASGVSVIERLINEYGVEPSVAYDAVVSFDPICKDIIKQEGRIDLPVHGDQKLIQSILIEEESILPEPYVELTDDALAARTYSDPLSFHEGMAATQRAEDIHQAMLRSINQCLRERGGYRILYNKFADLALNTVANDTTCHIIEIKSITPANIESQISKGLIQLSRLQFMHRGSDVQFHLVAEGIAVPPPQYLKSLADRLGISLHRFDQGLPGQNACKTLYAKLYDSNGSP